jgi:pimeloyl-ACP methyl ester carboxylesterase
MNTLDTSKIVFIHGLEGSSQGDKATLLRKLFPGIITPDFPGLLEDRMKILEKILGEQSGWILIGSSLGGLMAALFACRHPGQVRKLVLLAPALVLPEFAEANPQPIDAPTIIYHGTKDTLVPLEPVRILAERVFRNLTFHVVDDEHRLFKTMQEVDWKEVLNGNGNGKGSKKS